MKSKILQFNIIITGIVIFALFLAIGAPAIASARSQAAAKGQPILVGKQATSTREDSLIAPLAFQQAMRRLWEDHITWTRIYIIDAVAGLPETDVTTQRLLQNQVDIGNAIKPFYGNQAGDELTSLLKTHILLAAAVLADAKAGDTAKLNTDVKSWYQNADQIARFLHQANPKNWSLKDMQDMMKNHLDLTLAEAKARLNKDWTGDVTAYDSVHQEILQMSDMLAMGIVKQFPNRFDDQDFTQSEINLTLGMDKLWEDHVTWTRVYIISVTSNLPDANAAAARLLQNQVDIGNAIKPYYGNQAGGQLTALLKQHILLAVDILADAKAGNTTKMNADVKSWYDNANQIASFLSTANPKNWPLADMQSMMKMHLDLTLQEATARLNKDWAGDVTAYGQVHNEILHMSEMLSSGIIAQFPNQFK